jgi:hypothetical protein
MHEELIRFQQGIEQGFIEGFEIDNMYLPDHLVDTRTINKNTKLNGETSWTSLAYVINKVKDTEKLESDAAQRKRLQMQRVEKYRKNIEDGVEIQWETDDNKLIEKQVTFVQDKGFNHED